MRHFSALKVLYELYRALTVGNQSKLAFGGMLLKSFEDQSGIGSIVLHQENLGLAASRGLSRGVRLGA